MKFKILQWNVWYKEDPVKVANEIIGIDPDVICAQELMRNANTNLDTVKTISQLIKYHYCYKESVTWDSRPDITSQGNAIFSRYPIANSNFIFLRSFMHNPKNATHEGRVYLEVSINVNSRLLTVGTTQLPYSYRFRNTTRRKIEADQLCKILKNKRNSFIFTADLNATPKSYTLDAILKKTDLKHAGPDFGIKTWPTKRFDYHGFKENNLDWRIDYVFVSKDLEVVKSEVVKTNVSDHLPILTEVEV